MVSASDLQRYIDIYARRIRSFRPLPRHQAKHWVSIEALQAIQLVTGSKRGVLSPLLKVFGMPKPEKYYWHLNHEFANRLAPCMGLFVGSHVTTLEFESLGDRHLYCHAIKSFTDSTSLRQLSILVSHEGFFQDYLTSYTWGHLQELTLRSILLDLQATDALMWRLSSLRQLAKLDMASIDFPGLRENQTAPSSDWFPALRNLILSDVDVSWMLRCLPPTNQVARLECYAARESTKDVIAAIGAHCNRSALKSLEVKEVAATLPLFQQGTRDPEDVEPEQREIGIEPLLKFQLQSVDIHARNTIQVTPPQVERLIKTWRSVERIHLYSLETTTRTPSIDHSHILAIANSCRSLVHLGLRFDASKITSETTAPPPSHHKLHRLYVGDSPIYSPSAVRGFLHAAFPSLADIRYRSGCDWDIPIFKSRWKDVCGDDYKRISWAQ